MNLLINIWKKYATFLRYAVVGALGTAVDLGTLALLTELSGIDPQTSQLFPVFVTCAFVAAVINNYILNRLWTFKSQDKNVAAQFLRFLAVSIGGFLLTLMLMWVLVSGAKIWYLLAKAMTSLIVLVWNFGLNKMWAFRQPTPTTASQSS